MDNYNLLLANGAAGKVKALEAKLKALQAAFNAEQAALKKARQPKAEHKAKGNAVPSEALHGGTSAE